MQQPEATHVMINGEFQPQPYEANSSIVVQNKIETQKKQALESGSFGKFPMARTTASFHQTNGQVQKGSPEQILKEQQNVAPLCNSIKNMLSEEDFMKLNETIHRRMQLVVEKGRRTEEARHEEVENDSECAVLFRNKNGKTPGSKLEIANKAEDSGWTTPEQSERYVQIKA